MAGTLTFKAGEIRRLVEHSKAEPSHSPSYDDLFNPAYHKGGKIVMKDGWPDNDNLDLSKLPAGLFLVADQGVYLMSNGSPSLLVEEGGTRNVVAYAQESDPTSDDEDWYDAKRAIMGGDDSVDTLNLEMFEIPLAILSDEDVLKIKVTARQISVVMPKPRKK